MADGLETAAAAAAAADKAGARGLTAQAAEFQAIAGELWERAIAVAKALAVVYPLT